jgi:DNA-binding transcriptional MerR regulator
MRKQHTVSIGEVAATLGLPGAWTVRRLERRGVLPCARRTSLSNERYWLAADVPELRRRVQAWRGDDDGV